LWIEGKSNVHDFESRTTTVVVRIKRDSSASAPTTAAELEALVRGSHVHSLDVEVPVTSLHSGKAGLDKNLWQDLRAQANPAIRFHLTKYTVSARAAQRDTKSDTIAISAEGTLRIAGRERPVTLNARAYRSDSGLWIDGSQELQMTDFGIKPRAMMLGTLRVKDEVVVHYHLLLMPS
jgi:polyisoprenoid-binding protein YceI